MRRNLVLLLIGAAIVFGVSVAVVLRPGHGSAEGPDHGAAPKSTFDVDQARAFQAWGLYDAGVSFAGAPRVAILRTKVSDPVDPEVTKSRPNYVSFIYGDCLASDDEGCAPPLEIQLSPACLVTPADIELPDSGRTRVRGVPAVFFEEGAKLMFVTGKTTVSIYGHSRDQVVAAANALRGVNNTVAADVPLPAPAIADKPGGPTC